MTSPVIPPVARVHHLPEAAYAVAAALAVLGADAAAMAVWWWGEQGTGSPARTWTAGVLTAALVGCTAALMVRHRMARRAVVGAGAVALVVDGILVGYHLSGLF